MTFQDFKLSNQILNALDELGYSKATTIQQKVFPIALSGKDLCGIAQTGTGKTLSYLLPCIHQWKYNKAKSIQILILVPTRELVTQVVKNIEEIAKYTNLTAIGVYGGANINTQHLELQNGADILVATPGRLFDLAMKGSFKIKNIKKLIIDEVDEMLNFGFRTQLQNIMELMPERRQNMMFSATMIPEVEELIALYFNNPVYVEAAPTGTPLENISQQAFQVPNFNTKVNFIKSLLADKNTFEKVLIFVGTKRMADNLYEELFPLFEGEFGVIHSNKEQNHRFNTVKEFENGNYRFIIATDIVARGIDIAEVSHVINFDTPEVPENYIHRIGRTGRAEKKGISITFFTPKEEKFLEAIEALMSFKIPSFELPESIEVSTILIEDEKPKVFMKLPPLPPLKREDAGPAFHEKSAKNSKKNVVVRHKDKMLLKYGKPKKRGKKK